MENQTSDKINLDDIDNLIHRLYNYDGKYKKVIYVNIGILLYFREQLDASSEFIEKAIALYDNNDVTILPVLLVDIQIIILKNKYSTISDCIYDYTDNYLDVNIINKLIKYIDICNTNMNYDTNTQNLYTKLFAELNTYYCIILFKQCNYYDALKYGQNALYIYHSYCLKIDSIYIKALNIVCYILLKYENYVETEKHMIIISIINAEYFSRMNKLDVIHCCISKFSIMVHTHNYNKIDDLYIRIQTELNHLITNNIIPENHMLNVYFLLISGTYFIKKQFYKAPEYYNTSLKLARTSSNKSYLLCEIYNTIGKYYLTIKDKDKASEYYCKSKEIYNEIYQKTIYFHSIDIAISILGLGLCMRKSNHKVELIKESYTFFENFYIKKMYSIKNMACVASLLGHNCGSICDYQKGLEYSKNAFSIYINDNKKNDVYTVSILNNIGSNMIYLGQFGRSLEYFLSAYKIEEIICKNKSKCFLYMQLNANIGIAYVMLKKHKDAYKYFDISLPFFENTNKNIYSELLAYQAILKAKNNPNEGYNYALKAKNIYSKSYISEYEIESSHTFHIILMSIAYCKYLLKDNESIKYYKMVYDYNNKLNCNDNTIKVICLNSIGKILFQNGKVDESTDYYVKSLEMQDRLYKSC